MKRLLIIAVFLAILCTVFILIRPVTRSASGSVEANTKDGFRVVVGLKVTYKSGLLKLLSNKDLPRGTSLGSLGGSVQKTIENVLFRDVIFGQLNLSDAVGKAAAASLKNSGIENAGSVATITPAPEECKRLLASLSGETVGKFIILGMDGIDWNMIDRLLDQGRLPNVARMIKEGASGDLRSFEPTLSPLIWTTMATGRLPEDHGILDFVTLGDSKNIIPVNSTHRKVPAFWQILSWSGKKIGIVNWLASWPAEEVNGFVVTDRVVLNTGRRMDKTADYDTDKTWPPELMRTISPWLDTALVALETKAAAMFNMGVPGAGDFLADFDRETNRVGTLRGSVSAMLGYRDVGLRLLQTESPDILAVYFATTDTVAHQFMEFAPPQRPWVDDTTYRILNDVVNRTYELMDETIGMFLAAAGDEYNVIVLSDHGFKSGDVRPKDSGNIEGMKAAAWHRINGVLMAYGPDIAPDTHVNGASVKDITPTLLFALGVPVAENMVGKPLTEMFRETALAGIGKTDRVPGYERMAAHLVNKNVHKQETSEDRDVVEQLKALGYVDDSGDEDSPSSEGDLLTTQITQLCNLATRYMSEGRFVEAEETIREALELQPQSPVVLTSLGNLYMKTGELEEAKTTFEKVVELLPEVAWNHANLGAVLLSLGDFQKAEQALLTSVQLDPSIANGWNNLGLVAHRTNRLEKAIEYYGRAISLDDGVAQTHLNLGVVYWDKRDFEGAARELERSFDLDRKHMENLRLVLASGISNLRIGNTEIAETRLREVLELDDNAPMAHLHLGLIAEGRGDPETARREYQAELNNDPSNHLASERLQRLQ